MWLPLQDYFDRLRDNPVVCPYHSTLLLPTFEVVNLLLRMTYIISETIASLYLQPGTQIMYHLLFRLIGHYMYE
jgi:hypothetical protein